MKIAKRVFLFVSVNILIIATLSIVMSIFGIRPYLENNGINYQSLILFCLIWGFGGAFISLALSRKMAKWMMGVKLVEPSNPDPVLRGLVQKVHEYAKRSGIEVMPEVGVYDSPELNAFATGPTKNRALVAVSSGLLYRMKPLEVDGVLAHEVAHIANGDMVTMTLVQGIVNAFVMFLARVLAWFVGQFVEEGQRTMVRFGVTIGAEILLGMLGMLVVAAFSRAREFRADKGGAKLAGPSPMIAALEALKLNYQNPAYQRAHEEHKDQPALASLKISGKTSGFLKLFSTHPDLDLRIQKLKERR